MPKKRSEIKLELSEGSFHSEIRRGEGERVRGGVCGEKGGWGSEKRLFD